MGKEPASLMKTSFIALSLMVSGLAFAQQITQGGPGRAPRPRMGQPPSPEQQQQRFEQRLAQHLSLSAEQQNKVHTTLTDSRVQTNGLNEKMQALHTSLTAAMKNADEAQIDKLSQDIANLHQQQTSIHSKTIARIYSTLTPEQKTTVGDHLEMLSGRGPGFFGPPPGGPRGRRGPGQPQQ
jgi:Spy/CpxP family protein refolding chaperone